MHPLTVRVSFDLYLGRLLESNHHDIARETPSHLCNTALTSIAQAMTS